MDENAYYNSALGERGMDRGIARDLAGLQLAPTIGGMQFADLSALGQAGQLRDQFVTAQRNQPAANVTNATNLFTSLGGMGGQQVSGGGGPSALDTLGGLGQFGVNAGLAYGAFGGGLGSLLTGLGPGMMLACDRRLKADIEPTEATFRGVPLYTFRYVFDAPDVRRIGPMADEVSERARVRHPSGFYAVDMGAL
jgi:hypothetical protein